MTLFLIGYMGSGKSVIGETLAEILNFQYVDFDDYIETKEATNILDIFKTKGEIYFRKAEYDYLKDMLERNDTVVSLGGGTPCYGNNMQTLLNAKESTCIYLKTTIPTLTERLFEERSKRPLIAHLETREALTEFIGKHLFERSSFYQQSQISVQTDDKSVQEIAEAIVLQLY